MLRSALIMPTFALALAHVTPAFAGIGIFSTPDGASCNLTLPLGVPTPVYVLYMNEGTAATPPANGAEYRIEGMPGTLGVNYIATLTPGPGSNLTLGNAFDGIGHNVAWPAVQPFDANGNLLLATYTLVSLVPGVPAGTVLRVTWRNFCWQWFCCPLTTNAAFDLICQAGGHMRVNGGPACTIAVEQRTWTEVRSLYR